MRINSKFLITTLCMLLPSHLTACEPSIPSSAQRSSQAKEHERHRTERPTPDRMPQLDGRGSREADGQGLGRSKLSDEQVRALVETEYGGLFAIDERTISPNNIVSDFNGDGLDDIAVAVRLSRNVNQSDKSSPPFWFGKPLGPGMRVDNQKYTFKMGDLARYLDEPMLALLHGTRQHGLSQSQPSQRFVIVDAWDSGKILMRLYRGNLAPTAAGDGEIERPPRLLGDALLMIGQDKKGTALYWDGARYHWYPLEDAP